MKSFYEFYNKMLREQGQMPPNAPPGAMPAAPPQGPTGAGVTQPVPPIDPGVQELQQLLGPLANKLPHVINKIQDDKVKNVLNSILGQQQSQKAPAGPPKPPAGPPQNPMAPPQGGPPQQPMPGMPPQQ